MKGRSKQLFEQRNEMIFHRYYFYTTMRRKKVQYGDLLALLESEFSLSPATIVGLIAKNASVLRLIHTSRPSLNELRERYPFLNWSI